MSTLEAVKAIGIASLVLLASCAFDRDIRPEEFASNQHVCLEDEDCSSPMICFRGVCSARCEVDGDCAPGTCNQENGRCIGSVELGEPCFVADDCISEECVQVTTNTMSARYCTKSCTRDDECPPPMTCDSRSESCIR